jgi:DNA invertase Pin-like site-specific DNA recombinase
MIFRPNVTYSLPDNVVSKEGRCYIRQSTVRQVDKNLGSTAYQESMYELAIAYGFPSDKVKVIKCDQGRSGTTMDGRDGFKKMLLDILEGRVGAVFSSHSSRFARKAADMRQLIAVCEAAGALIIDDKSVYDPQNENDNFFLNLKGVFDEAESRRIRALMWGAAVALAKEGKYRIKLPIGYVWGGTREESKIVFENDERIQQAVKDVFQLLLQLGTAHAVTRHLNENNILFPVRINSGPRKGNYEWGRLNLTRLTKIYHNPLYAGDYVFGRVRLRNKPVAVEGLLGLSIKNERRPVKVSPEEWVVNKPDNHAGYISHSQYEANLKLLDDNRSKPHSVGSPRKGSALLSGLVFCGGCKYCVNKSHDRKMGISYPKKNKAYYYRCIGPDRDYGSTTAHQNIAGIPVDEAVGKVLLEAITRARLEVAVEAEMQHGIRVREHKRKWEAQLKEAKREEANAEEMYVNADLANPDVKKRLGSRWQQKIIARNSAEASYEIAMRTPPVTLDDSQREKILALALDMPALWLAAGEKPEIRKRIVRALIEKVYLRRGGGDYLITIHWRTGVVMETSTPARKAHNYTITDPTIIDIIRQMSPRKNREIAAHLNKLGLKTRYGYAFTSHLVSELRRSHSIPPADRELAWQTL